MYRSLRATKTLELCSSIVASSIPSWRPVIFARGRRTDLGPNYHCSRRTTCSIKRRGSPIPIGIYLSSSGSQLHINARWNDRRNDRRHLHRRHHPLRRWPRLLRPQQHQHRSRLRSLRPHDGQWRQPKYKSQMLHNHLHHQSIEPGCRTVDGYCRGYLSGMCVRRRGFESGSVQCGCANGEWEGFGDYMELCMMHDGIVGNGLLGELAGFEEMHISGGVCKIRSVS